MKVDLAGKLVYVIDENSPFHGKRGLVKPDTYWVTNNNYLVQFNNSDTLLLNADQIRDEKLMYWRNSNNIKRINSKLSSPSNVYMFPKGDVIRFGGVFGNDIGEIISTNWRKNELTVRHFNCALDKGFPVPMCHVDSVVVCREQKPNKPNCDEIYRLYWKTSNRIHDKNFYTEKDMKEFISELDAEVIEEIYYHIYKLATRFDIPIIETKKKEFDI